MTLTLSSLSTWTSASTSIAASPKPPTLLSLPKVPELPTLAEVAARSTSRRTTTGPPWRIGDLNLPLVGATAIVIAAWFGLVLLVKAATRPRMPAAGPKTMDLRPETPAVAEFLTGGWDVGGGALQATLLDLAARGLLGFDQVGPDPRDTVIRLTNSGSDHALTPYERRVLHRVQTLSSGGVVPARALAQGTKEQDEKWHKAFEREVITQARALGLSRQRYPWSARVLLGVAAGVPALLAAVAAARSRADGTGVMVIGGAVLFAALTLVGALSGERETPEGQIACSGWLGVRDWVAADEQFRRLPPAAVAIWDRYLAYGAAFGVTRAAIAALPLGARDERRAWSTYGGVWHEVRLSYVAATERRVRHPTKSVRLAVRRIAAALLPVPGLIWIATHKVWRITTPLAHGTDVRVFLSLGAAVVLLVVSYALYNVDGQVTRSGVLVPIFWVGALGAALWFLSHTNFLNGYVISHTYISYALLAVGTVLGLTVLWYLVLLAGALADLSFRQEVVGEVIRLRARSADRHLAIDPGGVTKVSAWPVTPAIYASLEEGSTVSVTRGRRLGYVYTVQVTSRSTRGNLFADPTGAG